MKRIMNAVLLAAIVMFVPATEGWAQVTQYSQDFEGLVQTSPTALSDDGWVYYVNVTDAGCGGGDYSYGAFPAPNGAGTVSDVVIGEGGAPQGSQQVVIYSDYGNSDHGCGNLIETNVYQQQSVVPSDIGTMVTLNFDAKMGNLGGSSTAFAFIKAFDAGWGLTDIQTTDVTGIPTTWGTYSVNLTIPANTVTLQFGFMNTASNYEPSGVFYDNVNQPVPVELMSLSVE